MKTKEPHLVDQVIDAWNVHNGINLLLIAELPAAGFGAVPAGSKGRKVVEQLVHMNRVRLGWLHYHRTGKRARLPGAKDANPSRAELRKMFTASGREVAEFIAAALAGETAPRSFGRQAVRWMGYLISHESHHRGQIMLALKQNGMRLPERVSLQGLWGRWIWGK